MRALATSRIVVFLTRSASGAEAVAARVVGQSYRPVGRRLLATHEIEPFLAELAAAGVEVTETLAAAREAVAALPAPTVTAPVPAAPASLPRPVESEWLSFSEIVLETQKIRGPNVR